MCDVNGDALLALGAQAVGEQCQVGLRFTLGLAAGFHGGKLIGEDRLGVIEQAADEG
ncbi:Uncharacterised protein [Mycobacteroides abscessus subsp. massiliense]|nr:Uncharacterised protein [Mycobacteroides abscessus subsp. massiliense]SLC83519.1 Uncharacterised protein [Mycobacteroides abscessus subsp. massiliense]